jgi:hypothetical protein
MSQEHVDAMNALLQDAAVVQEACADLGGRCTLTYDLADGPAGETVHWTVELDHTVRFSLARPADPDVVLVGDWARMIRATREAGQGAQLDPGLSVAGDLELVARVGAVLEVARAVGAIPVDFPDVP